MATSDSPSPIEATAVVTSVASPSATSSSATFPSNNTSTAPTFSAPPYPYAIPVLDQTWDSPFAQMDFGRPENCEICGEFLASYSQSAQKMHDHALEEAWLPGIRATTRCFRAALPPGYKPVPTDPQLLELFLRLQTQPDNWPRLTSNVTKPILRSCQAEVCRALAWEGNGDLSGVGVFASFTIEAVLATLYLFVLGFADFKHPKGWRPREPSQHMRIPDRLLAAFTATLPGFRSTAAFFCAALLVAALTVVGKARGQPDKTTSYEVLTATLVCVYSVFPVIILNALGRHERRKWFHRVIAGLLIILAMVQVNVAERSDPEQAVLDSGEVADAFMVYCPMSSGILYRLVMATYVVCLVAGAVLLVFSLPLCSRRWRLDDNCLYSCAVEVKSFWRFYAALPCLVIMWAYLVIYQNLRVEVLNRAGPTNKDNEWTFGQLVALLAWAPVIIEFGYRVCYPHVERGTLLNPPATSNQQDATPVPETGDEALVPLVVRSAV